MEKMLILKRRFCARLSIGLFALVLSASAQAVSLNPADLYITGIAAIDITDAVPLGAANFSAFGFSGPAAGPFTVPGASGAFQIPSGPPLTGSNSYFVIDIQLQDTDPNDDEFQITWSINTVSTNSIASAVDLGTLADGDQPNFVAWQVGDAGLDAVAGFPTGIEPNVPFQFVSGVETWYEAGTGTPNSRAMLLAPNTAAQLAGKFYLTALFSLTGTDIFGQAVPANREINNIQGYSGTATFQVVPEPSTALLMSLGLIGLAARRR